ncbi:MAG: MATE family efflux transporter [Eubacteriales bacterium]|nr:MATE family efflux transporter [Eubacteriales bacterium]
MKIAQYVKRFFTPRYMIQPENIKGELPSTQEIYTTAYNMAWPSTVEAVLMGLVGLVDTIMVGTLGSSAIAAVGITNQPRMIVLAIIMSLNVGVTAVVARRTGEGDRLSAIRCLKQCFVVCAVLSLLFGAVAFFYAQPLLSFAGAGADIIDDATIYFRILMVGLIFNGLTLTINAAQRGAGHTRIAMRTNIAANLVNVVFNYLLINGRFGFPRLGVAGAAIATVLGSAVGFTMALRSVLYPDHFLTLRHNSSWKFDMRTLKSITNVSSSALVEQVFMRVGFFTYAKIVAGLGTTAFATHQICMNIMSLSFTFGDGLSMACSALVGQNLGARRPDMALIYGKVGQRIALVISAVLSLIFFTLARPLLILFTDEAPIIQAGIPLLYLTAVISYAQISQVVLSGCLRGAGDTRYVALVSMVSIMLVRPSLSYLLCYPAGLGLIGAWVGVLIDQFLRLSATLPRFSSGKWTRIRI